MPLYVYLILFAAGTVAGVMNTVGGGGSVLTLPALMFAGVPPAEANATNRIGILLQNTTAIRQFRKKGIREDHLSWRVILVGLVGSVIGARLASVIPDEAFRTLLGLLMPVLLILILKKPKPHLLKEGVPTDAWSLLSRERKALTLLVFFGLGVYSGFIQAGVGIMILVALGYLVRMDLVRGNYVKLLFILAMMFVALGTFLVSGVRVDWVAGLVLTGGQVLGAFIGSWVAIQKGEKWIIRILVVAVLASSAELLGFRHWVTTLLGGG